MTSDKQVIDIAIVGGGPCGLATALHLAKKGCKCTVFESRTRKQIESNFTGIGWEIGGRSYPLALQERGINQLKMIHPDAHAKICEKSVCESGAAVWSGKGKPPKPPNHGHMFCPRDSFITTFLELVERDYPTLVTICFGARLKEMDDEEFAYRLRFSGEVVNYYGETSNDGSDKNDLEEFYARVVIGTDGVNSVVKQYLEHAAGITVNKFQDPTLYKFFAIPRNDTLAAHMHVMMCPGLGNMMVLPYSDGALSAAFLAEPSRTDFGPGVDRDTLVGASSKQPPSAAQLKALRIFFETNFPAVADAVPKASDGKSDGFEQLFQSDAFKGVTIRLSAFNHRRVLLLGDAAHATLPVTGQGVNCALRDPTELLHGPDAFWDGGVETASSAFAKFNEAVVEDRGGLFEVSRWISSNRWSWKYRFMIRTKGIQDKLNRKLPWLLGPPLLHAMQSGSYSEAWKSKKRLDFVCQLLLLSAISGSMLFSRIACRVFPPRAVAAVMTALASVVTFKAYKFIN